MAVINDILDYARIGSGKLSLEDIDFDPEILISETIRLFTAQALEKQLACTSAWSPASRDASAAIPPASSRF